jgi:hypothetical protein
MQRSAVFTCTLFLTMALCACRATHAQGYTLFSRSRVVTTAIGRTSEGIDSNNQDIIGANADSTVTNSECATTFTTIWQWQGGGAPQNPYTLTGFGKLIGSASGAPGSSWTVSAKVDGSDEFGFSITASNGGTAFGTYSNSASFAPGDPGAGYITAYIKGDAHATVTGSASWGASSTIYVIN